MLRDGSHLYMIDGNPAWRDHKLADIAARDGNAVALAFAWRRDGTSVFEAMTGGYVVVVIDCDDDHLLIAVDRMGINRLAYIEYDGGIVFSDKVGDVAGFGGQRPSVSPQALFNYIFFHQVPSPGTIYDGIRKLGPGQLLEYRGGSAETRR
ncbi:unnamed protein product, partial [marine sediment metagenome]